MANFLNSFSTRSLRKVLRNLINMRLAVGFRFRKQASCCVLSFAFQLKQLSFTAGSILSFLASKLRTLIF